MDLPESDDDFNPTEAEEPFEDEKHPKKSKKDSELTPPTPDAYLLDSFSTVDKEVLTAWAGTKWALKQQAAHKDVVVEVVAPTTSADVAKTIWRSFVHGARKRVWVRRDIVTGTVLVVQGQPAIFSRSVKCTWCNEHKLFITSNQVLKTHVAACPRAPKAASGSIGSLTPTTPNKRRGDDSSWG